MDESFAKVKCGCIYNENIKDAYSENSVCGNALSGKSVFITGGYGGNDEDGDYYCLYVERTEFSDWRK